MEEALGGSVENNSDGGENEGAEKTKTLGRRTRLSPAKGQPYLYLWTASCGLFQKCFGLSCMGVGGKGGVPDVPNNWESVSSKSILWRRKVLIWGSLPPS